MKNFIIILCLLLIYGCSKNIDTFSFRNLSEKDIYVEALQGYDRQPPVGYLSAGVVASSSFMNAKQVGDCVISWGYTNSRDGGIPDKIQHSPCGLVNSKGNYESIQFTFNQDEEWEVKGYE
jgi:hypothetical protein